MEENNSIQKVPAETSPVTPKKTRSSFFLIGLVFLLVIIAVVIGYVIGNRKVKMSSTSITNGTVATNQPSQVPQQKNDDFFLFSIPKPFENLNIYQLPNTANPFGAVIYKDSLWFSGSGNLVEYDTKTGNIKSYTDMTKANCDRNVVIANNFLFVACHTDNVEDAFGTTHYLTSKVFAGHYSIYKINPDTHKVEHIFTDKDGLTNRYNYILHPDGNTVWVETFQGLAKIDATTDKVTFYTTELGIPGQNIEVNKVFVDTDYVWVAVPANAGSEGGIAVYNKKTSQWKPFQMTDLKDYSKDRLDLEANFKPIPGGVQIAFRDGEINSQDRLVEKQYNYSTGQWTKLPTERIITGPDYAATDQYIKNTYPQDFQYGTVDTDGLTQLQLPGSDKRYKVNGRNNYILSPLVNGKRYVLTNSTIDVIDNTYAFRQILVKLGALPSASISFGDPSDYQGLVGFFVDPQSNIAVVTDSNCGGQGCGNQEKVWFVDLKAAKVIKTYTQADGLTGDMLMNVRMDREGSSFAFKDNTGKPVFNIDATSYQLKLFASP